MRITEYHLQEQAPDEREAEQDEGDGEIKDEQTVDKDLKWQTDFWVECT